jgi:hypothetical protein
MVPARQARHDDRENENHNEDFSEQSMFAAWDWWTPMHP